MSEVIAREVAEAEVERWCGRFDVTLDPASRETIVRAYCSGRLALDENKDEFSYRLRKPVVLENGQTVEILSVHEPTTGQVRDADKAGGGDFAVSLRLLSYVTGQPLGVLDRLGNKDSRALGLLFLFFG